jgi:hypothetical protein
MNSIAQRTIVVFRGATPRTQMQFVDRHRRIQRVGLVPIFHPLAVAPRIGVFPDTRCGLRCCLPVTRIRIALIYGMPGVGCDPIFVARTLRHIGNEAFPDARAIVPRCECVRIRRPVIEIAHDRHAMRIRRPDGEQYSILIPHPHAMRAELVVELEMAALTKQIDVVLGQAADAGVDPGQGRWGCGIRGHAFATSNSRPEFRISKPTVMIR